MTNEEKFREVFNIPAEISIAYPDICSILNCAAIWSCSNCPLDDGSNWDDEYKGDVEQKGEK